MYVLQILILRYKVVSKVLWHRSNRWAMLVYLMNVRTSNTNSSILIVAIAGRQGQWHKLAQKRGRERTSMLTGPIVSDQSWFDKRKAFFKFIEIHMWYIGKQSRKYGSALTKYKIPHKQKSLAKSTCNWPFKHLYTHVHFQVQYIPRDKITHWYLRQL